MKDRSVRRHQMERMKRRVASYYGDWAAGDCKRTGKLANTRTQCSCWKCCNPRRVEGPTRRERYAASDGKGAE